jgi:AAA family ATP:ADP antiporter
MLFGATVVYIVQPMRDAAAANFSTDSLAPLMLVAALLSAVASYFIGLVFAGRSSQDSVILFHRLHAAALLCFYLGMLDQGPAFFVYASVASALMMSLTWGFAAEAFAENAMSCFGLLGAAGTCGQLFGSTLIAGTSYCQVPTRTLLVVAVLCMEICAQLVTKMGECISRTAQQASSPSPGAASPGGSSLPPLTKTAAGVTSTPPKALRLQLPPLPLQPTKPKPPKGDVVTTISIILHSRYLFPMLCYSLCYSSLTSVVFMEKVTILRTVQKANQVRYSAWINMAISIGTFTVQALMTKGIVQNLGVSFSLALLPLTLSIGLVCFWISPSFSTIALADAIRKLVNYGLARPVREALFSIATRTERYQCKSLIDTVGSKAGATLAAAGFQFVRPFPSLYAGLVVVVVCSWGAVCQVIGHEYEVRQHMNQSKRHVASPRSQREQWGYHTKVHNPKPTIDL